MLSPLNYGILKANLENFQGNHLEIGAFDGEGIRFLALEFPQRHFYVIDPFIEDGHTSWISGKERGESIQHVREVAKINMNLPNITHYDMTTEQFIKSGIKLDNVETVMVDGSHNYDDVIIDIDFSLNLLKGKFGLIMIDDTNKQEVFDAYVKYFPESTNDKYKISATHWHKIVIGNF